MSRYYKTTEHNSVCVWDGRTGECMGTFGLYGTTGGLCTNNLASPDEADNLIARLTDEDA